MIPSILTFLLIITIIKFKAKQYLFTFILYIQIFITIIVKTVNLIMFFKEK